MHFFPNRNFLQFKPFNKTTFGPARMPDDKSAVEFRTSINGASI